VPGWSSLAQFAAAPASLADPAGDGVVVGAVAWIEQTMLGTLATSIAVIAVASVGLMMLSGRVSLRYGATVIGGCFLLFGASSIAAGIQSLAQSGDVPDVAYAEPPALSPAPPPEPSPPPPPSAYDPYAGATAGPR
jgi:type IV secretory pathway VirB2 component (pilin)